MSELGEILSYLGYSDRDSGLLTPLKAPWQRSIPPMVDDFYRRIEGDPAARSVVSKPAMFEGLRRSLTLWANELCDAPCEGEWYESRRRIGRRHVEVNLPPRFMPIAMNVIRVHMHRVICRECGEDRERAIEVLEASDRRFDLELAIMLESYREVAEEAVRHSERLATISRLAAGVSHELKNPLGVINTGIRVIAEGLQRRGIADDEMFNAPMQRIQRGANQARELTSQLLEFARVRKPHRQLCPVESLLEEALGMVESGGSVAVQVAIEPRDASVKVAAADLSRAVANVVRNAVQAVRDGPGRGVVQVSARALEGKLEIDISDDGPGVSAAIAARVFEPLFSTRNRGSGLGLPISRDLVEAQGGRLELTNAGQDGACFRITVPTR